MEGKRVRFVISDDELLMAVNQKVLISDDFSFKLDAFSLEQDVVSIDLSLFPKVDKAIFFKD